MKRSLIKAIFNRFNWVDIVALQQYLQNLIKKINFNLKLKF